jgi:hypothetical protein
MNIILAALGVIIGRIFLDVFFLGKMDAFYKNNKIRLIVFGFLESIYSIVVIKIVIDLMQIHWSLSLLYGFGAILGIFVSDFIKRRLDKKLEGQRKFFVRITIDERYDYHDLVWLLAEEHFDFTVQEKEYIDRSDRVVIEGSIKDRTQLDRLKEILRGRKGKHVTILRAEEVYMLR